MVGTVCWTMFSSLPYLIFSLRISWPGPALSVVTSPAQVPARKGWKLTTRPLLVSNSTEAPAYHLKRADSSWVKGKRGNRPLSECLVGHPDQIFSRCHNEIPVVFPAAVYTDRPDLVIVVLELDLVDDVAPPDADLLHSVAGLVALGLWLWLLHLS